MGKQDSLPRYNLITTDSFASAFSSTSMSVDVSPLASVSASVMLQLSLFAGCGIYTLLQIKSCLH